MMDRNIADMNAVKVCYVSTGNESGRQECTTGSEERTYKPCRSYGGGQERSFESYDIHSGTGSEDERMISESDSNPCASYNRSHENTMNGKSEKDKRDGSEAEDTED